ncbi:poly [ADP-ribose] polymerase [Elysia marginata]|uniref:Poly [ADP-ribose] polymerase n=1 Tax=Elysia marginata TaxID=1093978 RepID=A0AAV4G851_9GAST|nr:poly [ADP-ribose] polymerase [Elysia marginata]
MALSKMSGLGMTLQTPSPLTEPKADADDGKHHTLTLLSDSDERFQEIAIDFKNAGMRVTQVEMLANGILWKRYATEREMILEQRKKTDPDFKLNERYLYHGTSMKKSYICDEGLDSRMSNEGCFGKGIYFSDFPKKCVKYARKGNGDESYILLARVILGVPKVYPKGKKARALKREPEKEEPYTGHRFYDSVEGCPVNHKEFVVYESRRALVEGIITFTMEKKEKAEKKSKQKSEEASNNLNDLDGNVSEDGNDTDSDKEDNRACSGESSSEDEDEAGNKKQDSDTDSSGSDQDSNTSDSDDDGPGRFKTEDDLEQLLVQKRRQFEDGTGEKDEYEIERFLLRGGMNVTAAIKIYEEKKAAGFPESEDDDDDDDDDDEDLLNRNHPLPGSEGWNSLSKEDQEVFIEGQIDDFLLIVDLDAEQRDFARKCLSAVNMNLEHAVLAYYEDC